MMVNLFQIVDWRGHVHNVLKELVLVRKEFSQPMFLQKLTGIKQCSVPCS